MKVAKLSRNVKRSSLRLPVAPSHSPASYLIYAQFMWHFAEWSVANGLGHSTRHATAFLWACQFVRLLVARAQQETRVKCTKSMKNYQPQVQVWKGGERGATYGSCRI